MNDLYTQGASFSGGPDRSGERSSHLADYLALLRARPVLFLLAFLAVGSAIFARALFSPPVFWSYASLQVEGAQPSGGVLAELETLDSGPATETEVEILRSRTVALEAARRLAPGFCTIEERAHRPFEVLLGSFVGRRAPHPIGIETPPVADGAAPESYRFDFAGGGLVVERRVNVAGTRFGAETESETVEGYAPGEPFVAFGRTFTVNAKGPLDGRRYRLDLRSPADAAEWMREEIRVEEAGGRTGVIRVGFEAEDPRVAQAVAQAIADSYLELKRRQRRTNLDTALQFLGEEIRVAGQRLKASEEALDKYRTDTGALLLSDRATWIVEKSSALELERTEQKVLLAELQRARTAYEESGEVPPAPLGGDADPATATFAAELARLEVKRDGLSESNIRDQHPELRQLDAAIRSARERLGAGRAAALDVRLAQVRARIEHLGRTIDGYREESRSLPEAERRITELSREVRSNLEIHAFLVHKEQEAQLARASTLASVRSIDPAFVPRTRKSPVLLLHGLLAVAAGLAAAIFLCFFAAYLDRSVRNVHDLGERVGLPVYATVPDFRRVPGRRGRAGPLVARDEPGSTLAEVYRTLLANLRYARIDRPLRTLAVTSALPAEGKTVTLANLAVTAAALGERVLLVDADLRRPMMHQHFGLDAEPGLTDLLRGAVGQDAVLRDAGFANLTVVTAGSEMTDPGALLPSFQQRLDELKRDYDWVFVDMPPVLAVADPSVLLAGLDAVLLMVRYGVRSPDAAIRARDQIRHVGGNLLGFVFNAFDVRREKHTPYAGGYGYGAGYGYGYRHGYARRNGGGNGDRRRGGVAPRSAGRASRPAERPGGEGPPEPG